MSEADQGADVMRLSPSRGRRERRENAPGGRAHRHVVKVTPAEEELLAALAGEQQITVARLLVESAMSGSSETASERRALLQELFAVHRLVATIANNVNQIAKATNATLESQPGTGPALDAVKRSMQRLDRVVDALGAVGK